MSIDPIRQYMINGQVSTVTQAFITGTVANNQVVIAAITGKRIRVMCVHLQGTGGAIGAVLFKSASGGTSLSPSYWAPANTNAAQFILPMTDTGYFETNTGEGLYVDIASAGVYVNVFYITYTP